MSVPKVISIQHQGKAFSFTGWVGSHNLTTEVVFEFADEGEATRIWVDVNGNFVCEE